MANQPQQKRGRITIDASRCKGCEYCIIYCPKKCISLSKSINIRGVRYAEFTQPEKCIACNICARVCPEVCIEVHERKGGQLYQKMEDTISRLIDNGMERWRMRDQTEKDRKKNKPKNKEE
jgi:2-oxoglutarate ferredoxin oxidoreductase subunit delta